MKRKRKQKRSFDFLFAAAIDLVRGMGGRTIVEIGSIRNAKAAKTDGHSTLAWADSGLDVWSVDVDRRATQLTASLLGGKYPRVRCIHSDGIRFLDTFPHKIDLLYLDGPHPDKQDGRRWAAEAFVAALPRLSLNAVLLVDDTDLPQRGKGEFAIPLAESAGFTLLTEGRQALLVRGPGFVVPPLGGPLHFPNRLKPALRTRWTKGPEL